MSYNSQTDDELLRGVLYRADDASLSEDTDDADELMAVFMEGQLQGDDRVAFFKYLDTHPEARRAVGFGAKHIGQSPAVAPAKPCAAKPMPSREIGWWALGISRLQQLLSTLSQRAFAFAMATMLLFGTTTSLWLGWQSTSPVLRLAMRGGPSPAEYGISPDRENTITVMGSDSANKLDPMQALLDTFPDGNERVHLKSAYGLLHRKQFEKAQDEFAKVIAQHPESYYARLGQGIALHMGKRPEDFVKTEAAYREALKLHEHPDGARIGLAMTLSIQEGKRDEALKEWDQVDLNSQPEAQREAITQEMERLKNFPSN